MNDNLKKIYQDDKLVKKENLKDKTKENILNKINIISRSVNNAKKILKPNKK